MLGDATFRISRAKLARLRDSGDPETTDVVLLVEDSKSIRGLLTSVLGELGGLQVEGAASMADAEALLRDRPERFFCAVVDLNLPDAPNGEIVDLLQGHNIPVIVLTATLDERIRETMLDKRVVDYVNKSSHGEVEQVAYLVGRLRENRRVKILIVDDSASSRQYIDSLLRNYRYQTLQASNGREALAVLERHPDITLVITDMNMPEMDGMELIQRIRRRHLREEIAIVGLSTASTPGLSARLIKMGANDYLAKPFEVEELYCRVTQNTNMISYVRQIRDHATRDFLTGVRNRRHFFEVGETLYASALRGHFRLAAAVVDADHFKKINDRFGHAAGDDALTAIAHALESELRDTDIVARYGGEEFACLAVVKDEQGARTLFERLRASIETTLLRSEGESFSVTVSIGVTLNTSDSLSAMLNLADEALYQAKASGRNRVVFV